MNSIGDVYRDEEGFIGQTHLGYDGGDTLSFEGQAAFAQGLQGQNLNQYIVNVCRLECSNHPGIFKRSLKPNWSSECNRMSRDQMVGNIAALGLRADSGALRSMFKAHLKRLLLFAANTRRNGSTKENHGQVYKVVEGVEYRRNYNWKLPDITGPEIWGMYIRAFRAWALYPLLWLTDIEMLVSSIVKVLRSEGAESDQKTNETNHCITLLQSRRYPTLISWLARKIYRARNKAPLGTRSKRVTDFGPQDALDHFFTGRHTNEPKINELYRPILEKLL